MASPTSPQARALLRGPRIIWRSSNCPDLGLENAGWELTRWGPAAPGTTPSLQPGWLRLSPYPLCSPKPPATLIQTCPSLGAHPAPWDTGQGEHCCVGLRGFYGYLVGLHPAFSLSSQPCLTPAPFGFSLLGAQAHLCPVAGSSRAAAPAAVTLAGVLQSWRPSELISAGFSLGSSAPFPALPDALVMPPRGLRLHPCILILGRRRWLLPSDQQLGSLPHRSGLELAAALAAECWGHGEAGSPSLTTSMCHGAARARPQPQPAPCVSALCATCPPQPAGPSAPSSSRSPRPACPVIKTSREPHFITPIALSITRH